jgi:hypothetical protein
MTYNSRTKQVPLSHAEIEQAMAMHADGAKWAEIGRELAYQRGRRMPYQDASLQAAIKRRRRELDNGMFR